MKTALLAGALVLSIGQPAPSRPRITGIGHVAFRVSDTAAARHFYGNVLGLAEHAPARPDRVAYRVGQRQHVVLEPGLPPTEDERLSHIAFETTDVKAMAAYLTSRGVRPLQPAGRCEPTAIRIADPDGNSIEFVESTWPPPVVQHASAPRALAARLLHAGAVVRDEAAAHAFYRDTLGFSEIWRGGRTDDVTSWVNMRVPDGTDYVEYMLVTQPPDRRQRGVLHHICLVVPDIQFAWDTVASRTEPSMRSQLSPPNVGRNNRWQLNLYDPDGTRTELMEPFTIR
jgi:catechol 2,3-dioxygenase-like lactoylglutathione lyase family enzyme